MCTKASVLYSTGQCMHAEAAAIYSFPCNETMSLHVMFDMVV
jgi:hypothetical protein